MEADLQNKLWSAVSCLYHLYLHPTWPTLAGVKIVHNSPVERNSRRLLSILSPGLFTSVARVHSLKPAHSNAPDSPFDFLWTFKSFFCDVVRIRLDRTKHFWWDVEMILITTAGNRPDFSLKTSDVFVIAEGREVPRDLRPRRCSRLISYRVTSHLIPAAQTKDVSMKWDKEHPEENLHERWRLTSGGTDVLQMFWMLISCVAL